MKRLSDMSLAELWQLFPIILSEPNPRWSEWAAEEINSLHARLGDLTSSISHIGSTAIKGIWAKPIIDILIETEHTSYFDSIQHRLAEGGYICMKQTGTRIAFNKGYTVRGYAERVFHLHLRLRGDNDEIAFRDYLNLHPDVAKEYEKLKLSLWKRFEHDRDGYTEAKSDFVRKYSTLAKQAR